MITFKIIIIALLIITYIHSVIQAVDIVRVALKEKKAERQRMRMEQIARGLK